MKAYLKNYRQSPRKVRLLADLVRGKKVTVALSQLKFVNKRAVHPLTKLITSAVANAKVAGRDADTLSIKKVTVDQGVTYKRIRARARGRAARINKRNSNITIELG